MDLCGHRSSRSGAFLLSLLVLLGSAQATPRHAARALSSPTAAAFAANGHTPGGFVLGRARARRGSRHRCPHQHLSGNALGSEPRRRCGRTGRHQLRPPSSSRGRTCVMLSVDEQEQRRPHDERQQEGQGRHPESERGGLSRASFVQAATGSAAAVLALSMVSCTTCTRVTAAERASAATFEMRPRMRRRPRLLYLQQYCSASKVRGLMPITPGASFSHPWNQTKGSNKHSGRARAPPSSTPGGETAHSVVTCCTHVST